MRDHIAQYGMRNSNCMAIAPTATISTIAGCLPSIEPIYKNIYTKSNVTGEFTVLNSKLVDELKALNLWNDEMLEKIKHYEGSIQDIPEIPQKLKDRYKEVFEIEPTWVIKHAAKRNKWLDQSQSLNLFIRTDSGKAISDMYLEAWKSGLKTTYYLRTVAASGVEQSTININKKYQQQPEIKGQPESDQAEVMESHGEEENDADPGVYVARQNESMSGNPNLNICEACQ